MDWNQLIAQEANKTYYQTLITQIKAERHLATVYPPKDAVFTAFEVTPFEDVKVVIVGQDPYHQPKQAMGLSFSVNDDQPLPKSLVNIYKELASDLNIHNQTGNLMAWAKQGVFLLNTILTVRESEPLSHAKIGWEIFTDSMIQALSDRDDPIVFILWGKKAQDKKVMIRPHHYFIESSHPSPLGAYRSFFGSKPFSRTNQLLIEMGKQPIDWRTDV